MFPRLCLAMLLLALGACKTVNPQSRLHVAEKAEPDASSPTDRTTVALVDGNKKPFCSGSVIADDLILTSALCVQNYMDSKESVQVMFEGAAGKKYIANTDIQMFRSKGAVDFPQHNIAWIRLKEKVPAGFVPIRIWQNAKDLEASTPMLLAGYTRTLPSCNSESCWGLRKEQSSTFERYFDEAHINSLMIFHESTNGPCERTSGGPAFALIDGQWRLVGVAGGFSGISRMAYTKSTTSCTNGYSIYTAAGDYVNWIQSSANVTLEAIPGDVPSSAFVSGKKTFTQPADTASWKQWLDFGNFDDPIWMSVAYIQDALLRTQRLPHSKHYTDETIANNLAKNAQRIDATFTFSLAPPKGTIGAAYFQNFLPFQAFPNLETLKLRVSQDVDFSGLKNLPKLLILDITHSYETTSVKIFENLKNLPNLAVLSLTNLNLDGTEPLDFSTFSTLKSLTVSGSGIMLPKLPEGLESLTLQGSLVQVPTLLQNLPKTLTSLTIISRDLTQLPDLSLFPKLKELNVIGSGIQDFSGIANAPALVSLKAVGSPALQAICPKAATTCIYDSVKDPQSIMDYCINWINSVPDSARYGSVLRNLIQSPGANPDPGKDKGAATCLNAATKAHTMDKLELSFEIGFAPDLKLLTLLPNLTDLTIKNAKLSEAEALNNLKGVKDLKLLAVTFDYELALPDLESLEVAYSDVTALKGTVMPKLRRLTLRNYTAEGFEWNKVYPALEELSLFPARPFDSSSAASLPGSLRRLEISGMPANGFDTFKDLIGLDVRINLSAPTAPSNSCPIMMGSCTVMQQDQPVSVVAGPRLGLKQAGNLHQDVQIDPAQKETDLPGF